LAAKTYTVLNSTLTPAAAPVAIATGTAIRTQMQLKCSAIVGFRIIEFWTEFDGSAAATPIKVDIVGADAGPATTLTSYAATDFAKTNDPNAPASDLVLGASSSGYWNASTGEVTPATNPRQIAAHLVPPTSGIYIQYPLGREPEVAASSNLRLRTTAGASVNCYAGIVFET
jgi:hypothetical protein